MLSLSSRSKAVLLILGLFLLGAVCGATVERWVLLGRGRPPKAFFSRRPSFRGPRSQERLIHRFTRHLDLTPEQERKVKRILDESREQMMAQRKEIRKGMKDLLTATRSKIREILTSEQQKEYDKTFSQFARHWMRGPSPRGRPP
jgi:Spy/CpxP family protein refolding chaperone